MTGARGFIGSHLVRALTRLGADVKALARKVSPGAERAPGRLEWIAGDITKPETVRSVCDRVDTVFHLAGFAHADDAEGGVSELHWQVTHEGTQNLMREACASRVRRLLFVSSVKVIGEASDRRQGEEAAVKPTSAYGQAKCEAERVVLTDGSRHSMHVAVLRLPLVYGPGNKGNIRRMISAVDRGRFPPWPENDNKRSMVHVEDVVQALILAAENPAANGQIYIVTDGKGYSTREIYVGICNALNRPVPHWHVPLSVLNASARLGDFLQVISGRRMPINTSMLSKLQGSAWYSSEKIERELGFVAQFGFFDALPEMIEEYRRRPPQ